MRTLRPARTVLLALLVTTAMSGSAFTEEAGSPVNPSPAQTGADPSMAQPQGSTTPALNAPQVRNPESTVGLAPTEQPINNAKPNVAGQVIPSSKETAAHDESIFVHDQQPTLTHTFNFTDEQKQAIVTAIAQDGKAPVTAPFAVAATEILPATVPLNPLPRSVVAEMPWVAPYRYVKFGDKIVLVDGNLRYVAAIIE